MRIIIIIKAYSPTVPAEKFKYKITNITNHDKAIPLTKDYFVKLYFMMRK